MIVNFLFEFEECCNNAINSLMSLNMCEILYELLQGRIVSNVNIWINLSRLFIGKHWIEPSEVIYFFVCCSTSLFWMYYGYSQIYHNQLCGYLNIWLPSISMRFCEKYFWRWMFSGVRLYPLQPPLPFPSPLDTGLS